MTGYGSARREEGPLQVQVDIRSLNNRFFDLQTRQPRELQFLEGEIAERVRGKLKRGRVSVLVSLERAAETKRPALDPEALKAYLEALEQVGEAGAFAERGTAAQFLGLPDLFAVQDADADQDTLRALALATLDEALGAIVAMKEREGATLAAELRGRLDTLLASMDRVEEQAPQARDELSAKLEERLAELLGDAAIEPQRLAMEAAILVDRTDITEEIVRLRSHLEQAGEVLAAGGEISKKLGFLLQELLREANTIGSKTQALSLIQEVLLIKEDVEKLREQIQNLE